MKKWAKKKKPPGWLRWVFLTLAILFPIVISSDVERWQFIASSGIFSEERWAEVIAERRFSWAVQGLQGITFFLLFLNSFEIRWIKNRQLADLTMGSALVLAWAAIPLWTPLYGSRQVLWPVILAGMVLIMGYSWIKYWITYRKNKRLEETEHE